MSILYCGDTDLSGAASYLAGLMTLWGWEFDYVPSHVPLSREQIEKPRTLFIFSDYPAMQVSPELQETIVERIRNGAGLLMIGGWESFHGLGGDWDTTELAKALPVEMSLADDRVNFDQPTLLIRTDSHPALFEGPWNIRPPTIGGMNSVTVRSNGTMLLQAVSFAAIRSGDEVRFEQRRILPGLVTGEFGQGRTAAFMPDIAPHWVGGFVDWGDARVTAQAPGAPAIEVGNWYAQFWKQLLTWTGRIG